MNELDLVDCPQVIVKSTLSELHALESEIRTYSSEQRLESTIHRRKKVDEMLAAIQRQASLLEQFLNAKGILHLDWLSLR